MDRISEFYLRSGVKLKLNRRPKPRQDCNILSRLGKIFGAFQMFGGEEKKLDEADDNFPWILSDLNGFLNRREKNK